MLGSDKSHGCGRSVRHKLRLHHALVADSLAAFSTHTCKKHEEEEDNANPGPNFNVMAIRDVACCSVATVISALVVE